MRVFVNSVIHARVHSALSMLAVVLVAAPVAQADDAFRELLVPFVKTYCAQCHNRKTSEGELDLTRFTSVEMFGEHFRQWEHVVTFLQNGEMPPPDEKQPSAKLRAEMIATVKRLLIDESRKLAGDPGVVLPRRLSNAEYDYTIRDLTGVDINPADSFPVDPASGEGFNNTGKALTMSPALFKKYYAAAERIADHVLLKPSGMTFAPYSVVTYADRKKFYEGAIIQFYEKHDVNYEKYLTAAWSYRHRSADAKKTTIEQWADERGLSGKYLARLWNTLQDDSADSFYLAWLRQRWNALPLADPTKDATANIRTCVGSASCCVSPKREPSFPTRATARFNTSIAEQKQPVSATYSMKNSFPTPSHCMSNSKTYRSALRSASSFMCIIQTATETPLLS